jgi:hypothetical protein
VTDPLRVERAEIARMCDFAVWLPDDVPDDLEPLFLVANYDGNTYARYYARYENLPTRWLFVSGNREGSFPYPRSWRRRLRAVLDLEGTRIQISSSNGFATAELRGVRDSLRKQS